MCLGRSEIKLSLAILLIFLLYIQVLINSYLTFDAKESPQVHLIIGRCDFIFGVVTTSEKSNNQILK